MVKPFFKTQKTKKNDANDNQSFFLEHLLLNTIFKLAMDIFFQVN